ncbi:MAG: DNA-directed RNA polymerase subunit alpha [Patescibacteria group bacterium]
MDNTISMPSKPRIVSETDNKGVYEIDGLYVGYGYTLGNSLRRIILSSLSGAAITRVKIEKAPHEFSTTEGIKEDVVTILLNLKKIRFKLHGNDSQKATLSVKGAREATAKDIKTPTQLEVLNKDAYIATLTKKDVELKIEMTVEKGLGYVPKETLHKDKVEIGEIYLDALFTPIRRVNYEVENMRVGERTDYNRLKFFIETDGSISPREALEKSIEIMIKHLQSILGFQEEIKDIEEILKEGKEEKKEKLEEQNILKAKIDDMPLSSRTIKALTEAGIKTAAGLLRKKESDLMTIGGIGEKALKEIKRALGNYGLTLKE